MFNCIYEIERANKSIGHHFFDADSKRFFSSRILTSVYKNRYFITSERNGFDDYTRSFTVRLALDNGSIETIGGFNRFKTKARAVSYIKKLPELLPDFVEAAKKFWNTDDKETFRDLIQNHYEYKDLIKQNHLDWDLTVLFDYPVQSTCLIDIKE